MRRNIQLDALFTLFLIVAITACQKDDLSGTGSDLDRQLKDLLITASKGEGLDFFIMPASDDFANIPQDPRNLLTTAKVELGRNLYHETGLAINPMRPEGKFTYSCASCHHSRAGFQAGRKQGIGEGGSGFGQSGEGRNPNNVYEISDLDVQPIRTPSAMNGAWQTNQLWNGQFGATHLNEGTEASWTEETPKFNNFLGYEGLETQAIAGLSVHRMGIDEDFCNSNTYKQLFSEAYPGLADKDLYTKENAGLAIAAFERTMISNQAPFQQWLKGNGNAMFDDEKRGAILFFGKAKCVNCHTGPALNEMNFHGLGMKDLDGPGIYGTAVDKVENRGRGGFTNNPDDNYKFKVPQLYNLKDSPFYGHGGNFQSVKEVIEYKNQAIPENDRVPQSQLSDEFVPLGLTGEEIAQLTRFIENALYDANLNRYNPITLPSGFCFPNNDNFTKNDLGCN
ncbi:MAG: cytochrome-c peroxidase [Saprospiraceae bacterium]|nr:cytochrome-c peroxidase [Saprospiraceae bacterium]